MTEFIGFFTADCTTYYKARLPGFFSVCTFTCPTKEHQSDQPSEPCRSLITDSNRAVIKRLESTAMLASM